MFEWHRNQGHRLVLVSATIAPMAEAMGDALGMDYSYGCGPKNRIGRLSGSERGWSVPRRKGKVPIVQKDAEEMDTILRNVMPMEILWLILGLCVSQVILLR